MYAREVDLATVQARSLWNTAAMQEQFSKRKTTTEEK
jgi:hypothetical protein